MHDVRVVCQSCGKEFTYQTIFISTVGVAVCPCCGMRNGAATPRGKPTSPLTTEGHDSNELTGAPAQERAG